MTLLKIFLIVTYIIGTAKQRFKSKGASDLVDQENCMR